MPQLPEVISETPDLQNGEAVTKYQYVDGSVGIKADKSKYLYVTAPDGTKTTYKSERRTKVEKPDGEIEFYFDNDDNRLMAVVGNDNSITTYWDGEENKKYAKWEGIDRSEYERRDYLNMSRDYGIAYHMDRREYAFTHYCNPRNILSKISAVTDYLDDGWEIKIHNKSAVNTDESYTYKEDKLHNGRLVEAKIMEFYIYKYVDRGKPYESEDSRTIQSTEYYDDENHRIKSISYYKNGEYKEFYNNEGNTPKNERTPQHIVQYDEQGKITFNATDDEFGEITRVRYYNSGRIESIEGKDKKVEYYDNDKHSIKKEYYKGEEGYTKIREYYDNENNTLKEERDGDLHANGFIYDEDGNKTELIFKGMKYPLKDGKLEQKLITIEEEIDDIPHDNQYLFDDNGKVIMCQINGSYYWGDDKNGHLIYAKGDDTINLGHGQNEEWYERHVGKAEFKLTEEGFSWSISEKDGSWHKLTDDPYDAGSLGGTINPDGTAHIKYHLYGSYDDSYDRYSYTEGKIIDKEGNIIKYYGDESRIVNISNPKKDLEWKTPIIYDYGSGYATALRITERDGLKIKGFFADYQHYNGSKHSYVGKREYTCDIESGDETKYEEDGTYIERNLYNESYYRKYSKEGDLLEEKANGKYTKYEKGPDGKMRVTKEYELSDNSISKHYSYEGSKLKEIEYIKTHGCNKLQRDVFNDKEQKVCTFTYDGKYGQEKITKATFFDGETQKITSTKEMIDGKEVETQYREDGLKDISRQGNKETKYLYYPDGKLLSADTTQNGKRIHFEHYDKDGKDDTRMYLAKQKVAARQVEKGEQQGKVQKKLNKLSKAWQMHKALKEVDAGK